MTKYEKIYFIIIQTLSILILSNKFIGLFYNEPFWLISYIISCIIIGIYEGKQQIFTLDKIFDKKTAKLKQIMIENEDNYIIHVKEKFKDGVEDRGNMTIGDFLTMTQKVQPKKELRYKGLGELSEDDLSDTTMDPNKRTLVQLTVSDIEEAMRVYEVLHGKRDKERRELTSTFKINKDMLDN